MKRRSFTALAVALDPVETRESGPLLTQNVSPGVSASDTLPSDCDYSETSAATGYDHVAAYSTRWNNRAARRRREESA